MSKIVELPNIVTKSLRINDIHLIPTIDDETGKRTIEKVGIAGMGEMKVSQRFMNSLASITGINNKVYKYFDSQEVFERIIKQDDARVRVSFDQDKGSILGAVPFDSNGKTKAIFGVDMVQRLFNAGHTPDRMDYNDGIISLTYTTSTNSTISIGDDEHKKQFTLRIPLDGYGQARSILSILRVVCENGAMISSPLFNSSVALGDGQSIKPVTGFINNFNSNSDGFNIIEDRLNQAQVKSASVREWNDLYKALGEGDGGSSKYWGTMHEMAKFGNVSLMDKYGLATFDTITSKRQSLLPVNCSVYDLLQLSTEVGTHHAEGNARLKAKLDMFNANMLLSEFDLESTKNIESRMNGTAFILGKN